MIQASLISEATPQQQTRMVGSFCGATERKTAPLSILNDLYIFMNHLLNYVHNPQCNVLESAFVGCMHCL